MEIKEENSGKMLRSLSIDWKLESTSCDDWRDFNQEVIEFSNDSEVFNRRSLSF
jgi:hypothetical protein